MFILFINATQEHKGNPLAINSEIVATVHSACVDQETGEMGTFISCPPHGTWQVEGTVEEVLEILNDA
ncbi:hypothetical protein UFOVP961_90 [uncultured Caudovirales phage]|uniref:Uncharacterized protein n=1 Tax=uncultured Caudovirales phage TaxID=2100421 RepID=A0A6J5RIZ3_9CAUD|nr:hypothetical protein UFOVP961_90 [uncultured Caudovirales phage]CAB4185115.1 hypothetical protein UFOVP1123_18 [uncultured Caudovirales phage]CAB4193698.1 hypothetical protein UFOVP1239_132 [uncultured Caudovirales phage]CAB4215811.1 hypothetical protein UFOVP1484_22 [uncultured Caudovirales phage]CAB5230617.1 hypothetical protein UFOVP1577_28 [uncultured Caudovirales phage]